MVSKNANLENVIVKLTKTDLFRATLCISNCSIIITPQQLKIPSTIILIKLIDRYQRVFDLNSNVLILYLKTLYVLQLEFSSLDALLEICAAIENQKTFLDNNEIYYGEIYKCNFPTNGSINFGWDLFNIESEYEHILNGYGDQWVITNINKNYQICPSYPPIIVVPKSISDQLISKCAAFRKNKRFPILSYIYPKSGGYILRSSQPLVGQTNSRCKADEDYLTSCLRAGKRGYIVDTRSVVNIQLAKNAGGGTEHESRYPQWKRIYIPIDTPNFQDSYRRLITACLDPGISEKWIPTLDASNWLTYVHTLLNGARLLADILRTTGSPILIHGSDGCDSSAQLVSLIQIILNAHSRTYLGFQALIQREWLWMGHPFRDRCGIGPFAEAATDSLLNLPLEVSSSGTRLVPDDSFQTFLPSEPNLPPRSPLAGNQISNPVAPSSAVTLGMTESTVDDNISISSISLNGNSLQTRNGCLNSADRAYDDESPEAFDAGSCVSDANQDSAPAVILAPSFTRKKLSLGTFTSTNQQAPNLWSGSLTGSSSTFAPKGQHLINRARSNIQSLLIGGNVRRLNNSFKAAVANPLSKAVAPAALIGTFSGPEHGRLSTSMRNSSFTQLDTTNDPMVQSACAMNSSQYPASANVADGVPESDVSQTNLCEDQPSTDAEICYAASLGSVPQRSLQQHQTNTSVNKNAAAPTFVIFLDCLLQIMRQFPTLFEFNVAFVRELFKHAYASHFGTFLYNNCHERDIHEVESKTVSLWYYLNLPEMKEAFTNKFYDSCSGSNAENGSSYLELDTNPQNLELSPELFAIWNIYNPYPSEAKSCMGTPLEQYNGGVACESALLESLYGSLLEEEKAVVAKIKLLQKCF